MSLIGIDGKWGLLLSLISALFLNVTPVFMFAHFSVFYSSFIFLIFCFQNHVYCEMSQNKASRSESYLYSSLLECDTTLSLDKCLARNIGNHAPNYTASLPNTPKSATLCLSGHCTIIFDTLIFRSLHTKHLKKA